MIFPDFNDAATYTEFLGTQAALPQGFRAATTRLTFTPRERPTREPYAMNLGAIVADEPTERFAAVFTRNAFPGAPVILGRERMGEPALQGVLVNNKIANVRSATGLDDARRLTAAFGRAAGVSERRLLSVSTGIIGWSLPVPEMESSLPTLAEGLRPGSALDIARAIMTTDSYPKIRRVEVGGGSIIGIAKGAGMIEPNMATMLLFILTDLSVDRDELRQILARTVDTTFNAISVDGDMSTSDMVLAMSSGRVSPVAAHEFEAALASLCGFLAQDVVRNGEGTSHVVAVRMTGLPSDQIARAAAKAIVNSPLVKTAIYGNDPNVGRILAALGDYLGSNGIEADPGDLVIRVGDETVFEKGSFTIDRDKEVRLSDYLKSTSMNPRSVGFPPHQRVVDIGVSCGRGAGTALVWGSDLSDQYVHENADYRS